MPASIGVNLRVTGHCRQGGRKYMEDFFSVAYQQTEDEKDLEYAFFGIYDGHGGAEAAAFAKEHLMESIVKHRGFWSEDDDEVLRSIKDGFLHTHLAMWKIHDKWPKTTSGLPSTAGTTASIAFIRRAKIYIGHVGDSGITLGYQEPGNPDWRARPLTKDHKPECQEEMTRIEQSGGKVVAKSGVPRVVWNRPRIGHKGPVRRSTPIDEIPFLAVARSLGDLWSYNSALNEFVVSPSPDVAVIPIDTNTFRCLIFGTDGLYNMLSPNMAVHIVQQAEKHNEQAALSDSPNKVWVNPSKCLVEKALERWSSTKMRADNTSVITLMLDPPGPPRAQVLRNKKNSNSYSSSGLQIETRYQDADKTKPPAPPATSPLHNYNKTFPQQSPAAASPLDDSKSEDGHTDISKIDTNINTEIDKKFVIKARESLSVDTRPPPQQRPVEPVVVVTSPPKITVPEKPQSDIQINEVSSSSSVDNAEEPKKSEIKKIGSSSTSTKVVEKIQQAKALEKLQQQRKTSLRSCSSSSSSTNNNNNNGAKAQINKVEVSSTRSGKKREIPEAEKKKRSPLAEMAPETSSRNPDTRVLRERKNTPVEKNPMTKKKFAIKNKLNLNGEKKKLLQNVLFRGKELPSKSSNTRKSWPQKSTTPTKSENFPKTKENQRVLRNSNRFADASSGAAATSTTPEKNKRMDLKSRTKADSREIRKTSLAQKLRMHQETFKAKLRGRPKKLARDKVLKLKRVVGKR